MVYFKSTILIKGKRDISKTINGVKFDIFDGEVPGSKIPIAVLISETEQEETPVKAGDYIECKDTCVTNLEDEFFEILSLTEGDDFKEKSLSRINNTLNNSKRKSEELEEIIGYFNSQDLSMVNAALEKLNQ